MLKKVSAVIITYNESSNIETCITQLKKVVDEIIVVDSFSTDTTVEICIKLGAKVIQQKWLGYGSQKNLGNSAASNDWILSVDADEVLSDSLIKSLNNLSLAKNTLYFLDRHNYFGKTRVRYSGWHPDWKPRLFNKNEVQWNQDTVHEKLVPIVTLKHEKIKGPLKHYSYKNDQDHLDRIQTYAKLGAQKWYETGKKNNPTKRLLSPVFRFLRTYIIKRGFLDGKLGLKIAQRNATMVKLKYKYLDELSNDNL